MKPFGSPPTFSQIPITTEGRNTQVRSIGPVSPAVFARAGITTKGQENWLRIKTSGEEPKTLTPKTTPDS